MRNQASEIDKREYLIYEQYQSIIAPFIVELEARDLEFPIELLNEVRSIFTHLSRYKLAERETELGAAEKHVKRAILDCFKYMCVSRASELKAFRKDYRNVDLSLADNGKFLYRLNLLDRNAQDAYISAKRLENSMDVDEDELYQKFQYAYNCYDELEQFKQASNEAILFASNHARRKNTLNIVGIVVTVISIMFGILGIVL